MKSSGWFAVVLITVALVSVFAVRRCDRGGGEPGRALSRHSLENMTYRSEGTESGWVSLSEGRFEDPRGHVWVALLDTVAWGDVTGDSRPEAAVVLATNTGGSGVFHSLALVADVSEKPVNLSVHPLGDRVKLNGLAIDKQAIYVDIVTHGPGDPMCCPTKPVTRIFTYDGESLRLRKEIPPDTAPADRLD